MHRFDLGRFYKELDLDLNPLQCECSQGQQ